MDSTRLRASVRRDWEMGQAGWDSGGGVVFMVELRRMRDFVGGPGTVAPPLVARGGMSDG
jgi:hypothetical protein